MKKLLVFTVALLMAAPAYAGYDKGYIGQMGSYEAKYEDTFVHLARDFNLGYVEMRAANQQFDPWIPGAGAKLVIPRLHILPDAPHEGIVINIADMRLYAFVNGDKEPESYPLGVGREGLETPLGTTSIIRKKHGPVWTPTPRMRKEKPELPLQIDAFAPDNPMGAHALYLGFPQIAIHGTDKPFGIGRRVSSGCLRLYPEGIADLFDKATVGMKVTVVNQPVKLAWIGDELFIEAHPDIDQAIQMEETGSISTQTMQDDDMKRILEAAGEYQDRVNWAVVRTAIRERRGHPIAIARRPAAEAAADAGSEVAGQEKNVLVPAAMKRPVHADKQGSGEPADDIVEEEKTGAADTAPQQVPEVKEAVAQVAEDGGSTDQGEKRTLNP